MFRADALGAQETSREKMLAAGCGTRVALAMQVHQLSERVAEWACPVLRKCAMLDALPPPDPAIEEALISALSVNSNAAAVVREACSAVCNYSRPLCMRRGSSRLFDACPLVTLVLKVHLVDVHVMTPACLALAALSSPPERCPAVVTAGGVPAVAAALQRHITCDRVVEPALVTLANIARSAAELSFKQIADVVPLAVAALRENVESTLVAINGCFCVRHLARAGHTKALVAAGARQLVMAIISVHSGDTVVINPAAPALDAIDPAMRSRVDADYAAAALALSAVLRAMPWKGLTRSPSTPPCASGAKDDASTGGEGGAGSGSDAVTRP